MAGLSLPLFVRMIFERLILPLLTGREAAIGADFQRKTARTNTSQSVLIPTLRRFKLNVATLERNCGVETEIEAEL